MSSFSEKELKDADWIAKDLKSVPEEVLDW
jgi:hypothetical protein